MGSGDGTALGLIVKTNVPALHGACKTGICNALFLKFKANISLSSLHQLMFFGRYPLHCQLSTPTLGSIVHTFVCHPRNLAVLAVRTGLRNYSVPARNCATALTELTESECTKGNPDTKWITIPDPQAQCEIYSKYTQHGYQT